MRKGFKMIRRLSMAAAAIGAALTLMTGSGLFSLVEDSVTSRANLAESGTYAHDVKAAVVGGAGLTLQGCPPDNIPNDQLGPFGYRDGPIPAVVQGPLTSLQPAPMTVELDRASSADSTAKVCIKNFGRRGGALVVGFPGERVLQTETACSTRESPADTSCGSGTGELAAVTAVGWAVEPTGSSASCRSSGLVSFDSYRSSPQLISSYLAPGQVCVIRFRIGLDPEASESAKLLAQTDRVQWDIAFTLRDPLSINPQELPQ
jgi:hypothetical protein